MLIVASTTRDYIYVRQISRGDSKFQQKNINFCPGSLRRLAFCPRVCSVLVPTIISDTALPTLLSSPILDISSPHHGIQYNHNIKSHKTQSHTRALVGYRHQGFKFHFIENSRIKFTFTHLDSYSGETFEKHLMIIIREKESSSIRRKLLKSYDHYQYRLY